MNAVSKSEEACEASLLHVQLTLAVRLMLTQAGQTHPWLCRIHSDRFIEVLQCCEIDESCSIYERGKEPEYLYILSQGTVRLSSESYRIDIVNPGTCFGETGLSTHTTRHEQATALTDVCFWRMSRSDYCALLSQVRLQMEPFISSAIRGFPLLSDLPSDQFPVIQAECIPLTFPQYSKIISQGEYGDLLYLLVKGQVSVIESEIPKRHLTKGDYFGEQSVLYNTPRTASVNASSLEVQCVALPHSVLERPQICAYIQHRLFKNSQRIALDKSGSFTHISEEEKDRLIESMQIGTYERWDTVIKAGTYRGLGMWIVLRGELKEGDKVHGLFQCIGDEDVFRVPEGVFDQDVKADYHEVAVATIGREELEECLRLYTPYPISRIPLELACHIRLFEGLDSKVRSDLCAATQLVSYRPGSLIYPESAPSPCIFIVKSGVVNLYQSGKIVRIVTQYDHFGEGNALLAEGKTWCKAVSESLCECWTLALATIHQYFPVPLQEHICQSWQQLSVLSHITSLKPVKAMLGTNSCYLASSPQGGLYSVRMVLKEIAVSERLQSNLLTERNAWIRLSHPFIPRLICTFRDENAVYFCSTFPGETSLYDVMNERRVLTVKDTQFYAGCLVLVLEYIHTRGVMHRDIKPETIYIDSSGYVQVGDWASSKVAERTRSMIGTPHYMAPEMILRKTYGQEVDLWSLGVLVYELAVGSLPFAPMEDDPYLVMEAVLVDCVSLPACIPASGPLGQLLLQLLSKVPKDRGTSDDLKSHLFFSDFPFDSAINRSEKPPYLPSPTNYSQAIAAAWRTNSNWTQSWDFPESGLLSYRSQSQAVPADWDEVF